MNATKIFKSVARFALALLLALPATMFGMAVGALVGQCAYFHFWPVSELRFAMPMLQATARFQIWGSLLEPRPYRLVVETPQGSTAADLWEDWGPAHRVNLYKTPDNWLVALGGGGASQMFALAANSPPRVAMGPEVNRSDSETWEYIGAIDRNRSGYWGLFSPETLPECFAMFGAGTSPHRIAYHAESFCD